MGSGAVGDGRRRAGCQRPNARAPPDLADRGCQGARRRAGGAGEARTAVPKQHESDHAGGLPGPTRGPAPPARAFSGRRRPVQAAAGSAQRVQRASPSPSTPACGSTHGLSDELHGADLDLVGKWAASNKCRERPWCDEIGLDRHGGTLLSSRFRRLQGPSRLRSTPGGRHKRAGESAPQNGGIIRKGVRPRCGAAAPARRRCKAGCQALASAHVVV